MARAYQDQPPAGAVVKAIDALAHVAALLLPITAVPQPPGPRSGTR